MARKKKSENGESVENTSYSDHINAAFEKLENNKTSKSDTINALIEPIEADKVLIVKDSKIRTAKKGDKERNIGLKELAAMGRRHNTKKASAAVLLFTASTNLVHQFTQAIYEHSNDDFILIIDVEEERNLFHSIQAVSGLIHKQGIKCKSIHFKNGLFCAYLVK